MLLRSGVAALCLTPLGSAFSPASFLPHRVSRSPIRLLVGLHDQTSTADSDEVILQEKKNVAVLKEVEEGKAYIEWLIGEQRGGTDGVIDGANSTVTLEQAMTAATPGDTLGDSTASETGSGAGGAVELLGGGGGGDPDLAENFPSATTYRPALRSDLGDTVLLSGMAAPDATLLSTLNNNFFGQAAVPNFSFGRIRMLVTDAAAVRKQVIGREARYSGLLDKLTIDTLTAANGLLPSAEELGGATSWIAEVAAGDAATMLPAIADLAKGSAVLKNLVVLVTGVDANVVEGWDAVVVASDNGEVFRPTLLAAGALRNSAEQSGGIVHVGELGRDLADVDSGRTLPRARAYQLLALALALDATAGMTLAAYQYPAATAVAAAAPYAEGEFAEYAEENTVEAGAEATAQTVLEDTLRDVKVESRLVRSIREVGLTPLMELDVLAGGGVASFKEFLDNPPQDESDDTWMIKKTEQEEEDERILALLTAKDNAAAEAESHRTKEVELAGIAQEWGIREYAMRTRRGELDADTMTEQEFIAASREEAQAAAEETYARINSPEYAKAAARAQRASDEGNLFFPGMDDTERKRREMIVERVKKQYEDMLSDDEMEKILANEI